MNELNSFNTDATPQNTQRKLGEVGKYGLIAQAITTEGTRRFTISLEDVSCAIVSTANPDHLASDPTATSTETRHSIGPNSLTKGFVACQYASALSSRACN